MAVMHREVGKIAKKLLRRNIWRTRPGEEKRRYVRKRERFGRCFDRT